VPELVVDDELRLGTETGGGGGGEGAQVSDSTTAPGGRLTEEIGAPAAIGKVAVWPVTSFTVSVQELADADGSSAISHATHRPPTRTTERPNFRLINKFPATPSAGYARILTAVTESRTWCKTLLTGNEQCNAEPFPLGADRAPIGTREPRFTHIWGRAITLRLKPRLRGGLESSDPPSNR
jgi:hypothetical protein